MDAAMKLKFRMYRRGWIYYVEDNETGQQESLKTSDKAVATRLWNAKNESSILANSNLQVARAYMVASDPHMPKRTWKEVVDFIIQQKTRVNRHRWTSVSKHKPPARLWKWRVVDN